MYFGDNNSVRAPFLQRMICSRAYRAASCPLPGDVPPNTSGISCPTAVSCYSGPKHDQAANNLHGQNARPASLAEALFTRLFSWLDKKILAGLTWLALPPHLRSVPQKYWAILKIDPVRLSTLSIRESSLLLKRKYREAAVLYHPDRPSLTQNPTLFKQAKEAYAYLTGLSE